MDIEKLQRQQNDILKRIMLARLHGKTRIYLKTDLVDAPDISKKLVTDLLRMKYIVNPLFGVSNKYMLFEIIVNKPTQWGFY